VYIQAKARVTPIFVSRGFHQGNRAATSLRKASARWERRFFLPAVHLAEGLGVAVGLEDRVEAVALLATTGPDEAAGGFSFEDKVLAVRRREDESAAELGGPGFGGVDRLKLAPDAGHPDGEVAAFGCGSPVGGKYTRRSTQGVHGEAGVVGQGDQARRLSRPRGP
jgi:hypothetical protein